MKPAQERRITIAHRLTYVLARTVLSVAGWLPQSVAYGATGLLGRAYFLLARGRRRIALQNLRQAFPDKSDRDLRRIGARSASNAFKIPMDVVRTTKLIESGRSITSVVEVGDLLATFAKGSVIGVSGHFGSWEAGAIAFTELDRECHGIARRMSNPLVQRFIWDNRRRAGLFLHPRRGGLRPLVAALAKGGMALLLPDQNQRHRPVFVPFFGKLAATDRTTATLALRKGYPILCAACIRQGGGYRFKLVGEFYRPEGTGDAESDVVAITAEVNRRIERMIRLAPDQYLWLHNRYRTRPPEEAGGVPAS